MNKHRKPDLLCIGAQKAGTTWLHYTLAQHPKIWVPPFKEVHFFDHKFTPNNKNWTGWHIQKEVRKLRRDYLENNETLDRDYLLYLENIITFPMFIGRWYKGIFSPAPDDFCALDITPEYSCVSEEGIEFIKEFLPDSKFIYLIRDPFGRAVSQIRMQLGNRKILPESEADWHELLTKAEVLQRADYATYIPRWDAAFPHRMLYLPFGEIALSPEKVVEQIEDFAGLSHHGYKFSNAIHKSDKSQYIPDWVLEHLSAELQPQYDYLETRFTPEFNALL